MRRHDLPSDKQDWQIIDSTPVQMCDGKISFLFFYHFYYLYLIKSFEGIRRSGPCSVSSLKTGDLGFRWDSPFIHSSINGHKNHWIVYPDGNMELLGSIFVFSHCRNFISFHLIRCTRKSNWNENNYTIISQ
jgi:hypothetical protein